RAWDSGPPPVRFLLWHPCSQTCRRRFHRRPEPLSMEAGATPQSVEKQYPCSQCGANLEFAPGANSLKCPFCGFENVIAKSAAKIEELDYRPYLQQAADEKDTHEAHRVKCEKCGAVTTMPPNVTSGLCPFCGANMVFEGKSSHLIRPEALLP